MVHHCTRRSHDIAIIYTFPRPQRRAFSPSAESVSAPVVKQKKNSANPNTKGPATSMACNLMTTKQSNNTDVPLGTEVRNLSTKSAPAILDQGSRRGARRPSQEKLMKRIRRRKQLKELEDTDRADAVDEEPKSVNAPCPQGKEGQRLLQWHRKYVPTNPEKKM